MDKLHFIGLDSQYKTVSGDSRRRVHLDGSASPLASATALRTIQDLLPHYSNTHSHVHASAQISTQALEWAYQNVLSFVQADPDIYSPIFTGSGTTAGINRVARGLANLRPEKKIVLVSAMEHHANDLPHRQFGNEVIYIPLTGEGPNQGTIDLDALQKLLEKHTKDINYLAVSAVSNVTGIINPVKEITQMAHKHDVLVLLDAAQAVAHIPISLRSDEKSNSSDIENQLQANVDFFIFSGHKLYTPASPGVLIGKKSLLKQMSGQDLGGGSVSDVSYYEFELYETFPDREQSGTPNIVGAVALASVMQELQEYGMQNVYKHNQNLVRLLCNELNNQKDITVYGAQSNMRVGAVAFNHKKIDHGLLAAILNDYYMIATRNECFCAHPYVSSMLKETLWELDLDDVPVAQQEAFINRKRGMVRASISLYNEKQDIDYLINALQEISTNIDDIAPLYVSLDDGSYKHTLYSLDWQDYLPFKK